MSKYDEQLALEEQYSHASVIASIKQTQDALDQGRIADISVGKRLIAASFELAKAKLQSEMKNNKGSRSAYIKLLAVPNIDVLIVGGLRIILAACTATKQLTLQEGCRKMGRLIEMESIVAALELANPVYTKNTLNYLDEAHTSSINHRYRTLASAANNLHINWPTWEPTVVITVGRILLTAIYETGLFTWVDNYEGRGRIKAIQVMEPTEALKAHLQEAVEASRAIVKFPPMLVPPRDWIDPYNGGYLTSWYQQRAPMVSLRTSKKVSQWVIKNLTEGKAEQLKRAMNKAQSVGYRVNGAVLDVLLAAVATGEGLLGLPRTAPVVQPEFPMEHYDKETSSEGDHREFAAWKNKMHLWHTQERLRVGSNAGLASRVNELKLYRDEPALYFPAFADWRGRLYFRTILTPQNNDVVKGCLQRVDGKPLGERGMFWLLVHIANCAGYDKHDPAIKAQWALDNMGELLNFASDPLNIKAPEPDTAFTLLAALFAYREALALANPFEYVCHIAVAMDATCSGLQHFSAMLRDPIGGLYTNLVDNGADQKSDIYKHVGQLADGMKGACTKDAAIANWWSDKAIPRSMAKRPVMTYVYGATLQSTMEYVSLDMHAMNMQPIKDTEGKPLYSLHKLSVPVAMALRKGVAQAVPSAAAGMAYLHSLVRASAEPIRWINAVGMPVINWVETETVKIIKIRSMGRIGAHFRYNTGEYHRRRAAAGIAPNFTHSCDGAHLCMTIDVANCDITPIHDSFATLPCDVDHMHYVLRDQFIELYVLHDPLRKLAAGIVIREDYDITYPQTGNLDLESIRESRFMFC